MSCYFLGVDVGGTKTHALITDETGQAVGFGEEGPGNHEMVGYAGLSAVLQSVTRQALASAGLAAGQLAGAGFGVAGYDFACERAPTLEVIGGLRLKAPVEAVNDALLGLLAGSEEGWGVAVVSGTGCNAWGWDPGRKRIGQVTGGGTYFGEGAGASDLIGQAMRALAYEWTGRGPATQLTPLFLQHTGAADLMDLLEGVMHGRYSLTAAAAPLVFQAAAAGDAVALDLVDWAGTELGELAKTVIRQLKFETLAFDVVQIGSMWDGSPRLTERMQAVTQALAPGARIMRLAAPPVAGAVVLGMEAAGRVPAVAVRERLVQTAKA